MRMLSASVLVLSASVLIAAASFTVIHDFRVVVSIMACIVGTLGLVDWFIATSECEKEAEHVETDAREVAEEPRLAGRQRPE